MIKQLSNMSTGTYYSTIVPFYHIRAKEHVQYATLLHCRTEQKYGLKRSNKMAAQNERNFAFIYGQSLKI